MTAKIIEFPGNAGTPPGGDDEEQRPRRSTLRPGPEVDRELDRELRKMDGEHPVRQSLLKSDDSAAFSNVMRLLRQNPRELLVFCNTLSGPDDAGVPWGDIYCLTDGETYRYIFTMYTAWYVRECQMRRGEVIEASPENIILQADSLGPEHLTEAVNRWVGAYYPGLTGIPVRQEEPEAVREMIESSLEEDDP